MRVRRFCRASRIRRRYGCFRLPSVPGARAVIENTRKGISWLARTDPVEKTVEFSEAFDELTSEKQRFIVLHERAHLLTGPDHNDHFYDALKRLIPGSGVSWKTAFEMESFNCHQSH